MPCCYGPAVPTRMRQSSSSSFVFQFLNEAFHLSLRSSALKVLASEIYQHLVVGIQIARFGFWIGNFIKVTNWTFKARLKSLPMDGGEQSLGNQSKTQKGALCKLHVMVSKDHICWDKCVI